MSAAAGVAGVDPSIEALAEVLASYSSDELDELGQRSRSPLLLLHSHLPFALVAVR
jgi:hypothetical protein